ncbi:MAG: GNAT family N-acetyltransferase, partial [Candidatus Lokiarchaeota archaeon]|nr:GNAT family N-acetyltransferase [Candidatus Lokiarchaeota archaeon]
WCSLGINVDINRAIVDVAKIVIAQINPQMPVTMGDSFIRFEDIDYFYYYDSPLMDYVSTEPDEKTQKICEYIARIIEDGSTLNLGIGKIPDLLPQYLEEKKDLAIYSEFILDSIIPLIKHGVITCKKNHRPHCMTSFALGNHESYEYYNKNPFIEFHPTDYITNITNISRNNKMCSVYSALTVDSIGQTTNDLKSTLYSGIGGEADMMRGTSLSQDGKCIVALPSTTEDGRSRILPILSTHPVAVPAFDVHYVVTEYGIAYLHGKSLRERIMQMIGVAHPKYREWLLKAAKQYHFVYEDQKLPQTRDGVVVIYPDIEWTYETKNKGRVYFRPVRPTDERMFQELYYNLSEKDRIMRFFKPHKFFTHEETQDRIMVDYHTKMVFVGLIGEENKSQRIIASAAYYLNQSSNLVEISVTVDPEYRGQGIAKHLVKKIVEVAERKRFSGICGDVLLSNAPMIHILKSLDYNVTFTPDGHTLEFEIRFDDKKTDAFQKEAE